MFQAILKIKIKKGKKWTSFSWAWSWLFHPSVWLSSKSLTHYIPITSFFFRNPAIKVLTLVIFNINTSFSCIIAKNNQVIIHYYMKTINLSNMLHNPHIVCSTSGILFAFGEPLRHSSMMASRIVKCFGTLNVH